MAESIDYNGVVIHGFTIKTQHTLDDGTVVPYAGAIVFGDDGEGGLTTMASDYTLEIYDNVQFYVYEKAYLSSNYEYSIAGYCAPAGSTIYLTPQSSINSYTELLDQAVHSVQSDDEGYFSTTVQGWDDNILIWIALPPTLSSMATAELGCSVLVESDDIYSVEVSLRQPIYRICPSCSGTGRVDGETCSLCEGIKKIEELSYDGYLYAVINTEAYGIMNDIYLSNLDTMGDISKCESCVSSEIRGSATSTLSTEQIDTGTYYLWTPSLKPLSGDSDFYNYSFNGVELVPPVIDINNTSTYDSVIITRVDSDYVDMVGHSYVLYYVVSGYSSELKLNSDHTKLIASSGESRIAHYVYRNYWLGVAPDSIYSNPMYSEVDLVTSKETIIWTRYDLYDEDGNIYMAGSVPEETPITEPMIRAKSVRYSTGSSTGSCLSGDTLITMADSTYKRMDEVCIGDVVMSEDGSPTKVRKVGSGYINPYHILYTFDDGTVIDETHTHRFYNATQGFYQNLERWDIGDCAKSQNGSTPALVSVDRIDEEAECFGIWTESGTYYANGLVSGSAECNVKFIGDATTEQAMDMALSFSEEQLMRLFDGGKML